MNDELRETIENALVFSRDSLAEHAAAHITDGESVLAAEIARHNAALAWLEQQPHDDTPKPEHQP